MRRSFCLWYHSTALSWRDGILPMDAHAPAPSYGGGGSGGHLQERRAADVPRPHKLGEVAGAGDITYGAGKPPPDTARRINTISGRHGRPVWKSKNPLCVRMGESSLRLPFLTIHVYIHI